LVVPNPIAETALAYFFGTVAYSFLLAMYGYIFFTWMEVVYYASHPSWAEERLRRFKFAFLAWIALVGTVLAISAVAQQATHAQETVEAGELPLIIAFTFHAILLSIGFSVCLSKLLSADHQYGRFTDLFKRLTKLNFAFLGTLISLVICTVFMIILKQDVDLPTPTNNLIEDLFFIFFFIPPLVIPPVVMWFFNPYAKLLKAPEEDISGAHSGTPPTELGGSDAVKKDSSDSQDDRKESFCLPETKDSPTITPSPQPAELSVTPTTVMVRTDSQVNLNPAAVPPIML